MKMKYRLPVHPVCITVVPFTYKAVVTLPHEKSIQFINSLSNITADKVQIGEHCCWGVTAAKSSIFLGEEGKVFMLDIDGFCLRELTTGGGYNYYN